MRHSPGFWCNKYGNIFYEDIQQSFQNKIMNRTGRVEGGEK